MDEIVIRRWTKYGHDRGYAELPDGTKLGWVDLRSGKAHLEAVSDANAVFDTLAAYRDRIFSERAAQEHHTAAVAPNAEPPSWQADLEPITIPYTDLATHIPGKGVRDRAQVEWEASKSRGAFRAHIARAFDARTDERAWRKGAEGEEAIGLRLNDLHPHGWGVLHSVPVGSRGADIDHVLIGPAGVFTINSKYHPGARVTINDWAAYVNGSSYPYLEKSRAEGDRASKLLSRAMRRPVHVHPCLVISTGQAGPAIIRKGSPDGVSVLGRNDVPGWFRAKPRDLAPAEVNAIFDVARRSTTWV